MPKTPHFGWDTPVLVDEADVPADLLSLATEIEEDLHNLQVSELGTAGAGDAKKILIVQNTGAAAWQAMSGDATISEAGAITVGAEKITQAKIALLAIAEGLLAGEAVGTAKIKALAVTAAKLAAEAVETAKIANLAVTEAKLAALAVGTAKLANAAVTPEKLNTEAKRLFPQLVEGLRAKDRMVNFSQEFVNEGVKEWEATHGLPGVTNHQNLQLYYGVFNNNAVPSAKDIVTVKAVTSTKMTFRREGAELKTLLFWWKAEVW